MIWEIAIGISIYIFIIYYIIYIHNILLNFSTENMPANECTVPNRVAEGTKKTISARNIKTKNLAFLICWIIESTCPATRSTFSIFEILVQHILLFIYCA